MYLVNLIVGLTDLITHRVDVIDLTAIRHLIRTISHHLLKEVQGIIHIQMWLNQGIIKETNIQYASQITLVMKQNGKVRVFINFRG